MEQLVSRKKVVSGIIWRYLERTAAQGVQIIVSIVLARLLTPSDYGLVGLIAVFITIANVFVQSGFGSALIQKKNADDTDFSSVFYFNIAISLLLYAILFLCAPLIAMFYEEPMLTPLVRVLGLSLIIMGLNGVQQAYVSKTMQFKKFFYATIVGTIISAVIGIYMAYHGCGVWSLVVQNLSNYFIDTVVLWFTVQWRPKRLFSVVRMKSLFSYGWKLLVSNLIDTVYNNIYSLVIGKFYSADDLGYYNRGKNIPSTLITNINGSIQSVIFPAMASVQDDKERVKSMVRRAIMTSTFIIFPMMAGLAAVSKPLTIILLTEKWLPSVAFMQFCCFTYAFWPIHTANLQAINALGRSDIFLKIEIAKKVIGILVLIVTIPFGLYTMMIGRCIVTIISSFINAYPNKKLLNYSYFEQLKDIMPAFVLSLAMCALVLGVTFFDINVYVMLLVQVIIGVVVYIVGAKLFKLESLDYLLSMRKNRKSDLKEEA